MNHFDDWQRTGCWGLLKLLLVETMELKVIGKVRLDEDSSLCLRSVKRLCDFRVTALKDLRQDVINFQRN
jgi:hypothetical protein